jgi:murein L,D-transpeptidase YcbB/YkuD
MKSENVQFLLRAVVLALLAAGPCAAAQPTVTSGTIPEILAAGQLPDGEALDILPLRAFYQTRGNQPAWSGSAVARAEAREMVSALVRADEDGLDPSIYHVQKLRPAQLQQPSLDAAEYDVLLSDGALQFARDLRAGRPELKTLDDDVDLPRQNFDAAGALAAAISTNGLAGFLESLAPPQREYAELKAALSRYRAIAGEGGWPVLPESFPADPEGYDLDLLRRRLGLEDSPAADTGEIVAALERFQSRHGLAADGEVEPETRAALNVPASERVLEIEANMERWRWMPRAFETNYVIVNVPEETLRLFGPAGTVLTSRVIVGRAAAPTPILRALATSVTVNPPWNVPEDIARREILPKLRAHRDYLLKHDMILRDGPRDDPFGLHVDWNAVPAAGFHYHVQQQPGPRNALGTIKLELPNRFDVYLHYTSAESAFALDSRALSHGCVRVEQILPLASYALSHDPAAAVASLQSAIAAGKTQHLRLAAPLPVYLLYSTAFADPDGSMEFRPDIYGRDMRLIAALGSRVGAGRVTLNTVQCQPG